MSGLNQTRSKKRARSPSMEVSREVDGYENEAQQDGKNAAGSKAGAKAKSEAPLNKIAKVPKQK